MGSRLCLGHDVCRVEGLKASRLRRGLFWIAAFLEGSSNIAFLLADAQVSHFYIQEDVPCEHGLLPEAPCFCAPLLAMQYMCAESPYSVPNAATQSPPVTKPGQNITRSVSCCRPVICLFG